MGAPVPGGADPVKWCGAALANPVRRAAAHAHIDALIGQLPTEEDAALTPVEREPPKAQQQDNIVTDGDGYTLGEWRAGKYGGYCPCESGEMFQDCHGTVNGPDDG